MRYSKSYADPGLKMRKLLPTAPGILGIWVVYLSMYNRDQHCLTLVMKWVPICPTRQDARQEPEAGLGQGGPVEKGRGEGEEISPAVRSAAETEAGEGPCSKRGVTGNIDS
jgi:hypothetical protein